MESYKPNLIRQTHPSTTSFRSFLRGFYSFFGTARKQCPHVIVLYCTNTINTHARYRQYPTKTKTTRQVCLTQLTVTVSSLAVFCAPNSASTIVQSPRCAPPYFEMDATPPLRPVTISCALGRGPSVPVLQKTITAPPNITHVVVVFGIRWRTTHS